jgi:serine/threonine-protein kinase
MATQPGEQFGRYVLVSQLGRGGMAETWRARLMGDAGVTKPVLIKKVLPEFANDQAFTAMFVSEARISATLSHGNIAQVFDFGRVDGEYFLAMEFVDGQPLNRVLKRAQKTGLSALPVPLATYIALEMCRGLHYAHTRTDDSGAPLGIVHRDISPDNVLLSYEGQVKIVDFGIAKARALRGFKTEPGVVKGKYLFFSPEQARGEDVDARSDVWATAVVLYELLCGRLPFEGPPHVVLRKLIQGEFPHPRTLRPDLPQELNDLVMRALTVRREERFESCHEFGDALAGFLYSTAPRFSPMVLSYLVKELFRGDLSSDGREVRVPPSFLEDLSLWREELSTAAPQPAPAKAPQAPAETQPERPSMAAPKTQRPRRADAEEEDALDEVPPEQPRSRRTLFMVAGGAVALAAAVAAVALVPGSPPADPSRPMPLARPEGQPLRPLAVAEAKAPAPQPPKEPAPPAKPPTELRLRLNAKEHIFRVPTEQEIVVDFKWEETYRVYEPNPPANAPPLYFLHDGASDSANWEVGMVDKKPLQVTRVTQAHFFTLGTPPERTPARTVRVENVRTRARTLVTVVPGVDTASLDNTLRVQGLEASGRYELKLLPVTPGAFTRAPISRHTHQVACARQLAPEAIPQGEQRMRPALDPFFLLRVGQPMELEGTSSLSCGFIDDDPKDNQGSLELVITKQQGATTSASTTSASTTSAASSTTGSILGHENPEIAALVLAAGQHMREKRYQEALNLMHQCIKLAPATAECHMRLGSLYAALGHSDQAVQHYREFVALSPDNPAAAKVRQFLKAYYGETAPRRRR